MLKAIRLSAALVALSAVPAVAHVLTCTVTGPAGLSSSQVLTISVPDGNRLVTWAQNTYGPIAVAPLRSDLPFCEDVPTPADCLPTSRSPTPTEAMNLMFLRVFDDLRDHTQRFDVENAAKAAKDGVAPIAPQ
jgi:hypothetical protein